MPITTAADIPHAHAADSNEDVDLPAVFGPQFGVLLKELFAKIVPVERIVMMCPEHGRRWHRRRLPLLRQRRCRTQF